MLKTNKSSRPFMGYVSYDGTFARRANSADTDMGNIYCFCDLYRAFFRDALSKRKFRRAIRYGWYGFIRFTKTDKRGIRPRLYPDEGWEVVRPNPLHWLMKRLSATNYR